MQDKVILVSGGGTGIGAAIARNLASEGATVIVLGRRTAPLESIAGEINGLAIPGDATKRADCSRALDLTLDRFGRLDGLVANAGAGGGATALETGESDWAAALDGNLTATFALTRAALPALIESRGAVVVVSSLAGLFAPPAHLGYTTAKHGLIGLARSLARDYGPLGVRVNAVCPGAVRTEMLEGIIGKLAARAGITIQEALARGAADLPLRRIAEPAEIATICTFLLSDEASIVTGAVIPADAGASVVDPGSLGFESLGGD
jgi:NAD(P)-dependent dehydrogenase (short-subunit alcohol dehydrogenase family)